MAATPGITRQCYRRNTSGHSIAERPELHTEPLEANPLPPTLVLIRVCAVALNYRDANILNGTNPWPVNPDGIPCSDAAGDALAVEDMVTRFRMRDRVAPILDQKSITKTEQEREWLGGEVDGVLESHVGFDQEKVVKIPEHFSYAEAACLPNAGVTAWTGLMAGGGLVPGMTVVVQC